MTDAPRKYRPSNATEGFAFMAVFCDQCVVRGICRILPRVMGLHVDDPDYPGQWTYDDEGAPTCTSFKDGTEPRRRKPCKGTADLFDQS